MSLENPEPEVPYNPNKPSQGSHDSSKSGIVKNQFRNVEPRLDNSFGVKIEGDDDIDIDIDNFPIELVPNLEKDTKLTALPELPPKKKRRYFELFDLEDPDNTKINEFPPQVRDEIKRKMFQTFLENQNADPDMPNPLQLKREEQEENEILLTEKKIQNNQKLNNTLQEILSYLKDKHSTFGDILKDFPDRQMEFLENQQKQLKNQQSNITELKDIIKDSIDTRLSQEFQNKLRKAKLDYEEERIDLNSQITQLKERIESGEKGAKDQLQKLREEQHQENEKYRKEIEELTRQNQEQKDEMTDLQISRNTLEQTQISYRNELKNLKDDKTRKQNQIDELNDQIQKLSRENRIQNKEQIEILKKDKRQTQENLQKIVDEQKKMVSKLESIVQHQDRWSPNVLAKMIRQNRTDTNKQFEAQIDRMNTNTSGIIERMIDTLARNMDRNSQKLLDTLQENLSKPNQTLQNQLENVQRAIMLNQQSLVKTMENNLTNLNMTVNDKFERTVSLLDNNVNKVSSALNDLEIIMINNKDMFKNLFEQGGEVTKQSLVNMKSMLDTMIDEIGNINFGNKLQESLVASVTNSVGEAIAGFDPPRRNENFGNEVKAHILDEFQKISQKIDQLQNMTITANIGDLSNLENILTRNQQNMFKQFQEQLDSIQQQNQVNVLLNEFTTLIENQNNQDQPSETLLNAVQDIVRQEMSKSNLNVNLDPLLNGLKNLSEEIKNRPIVVESPVVQSQAQTVKMDLEPLTNALGVELKKFSSSLADITLQIKESPVKVALDEQVLAQLSLTSSKNEKLMAMVENLMRNLPTLIQKSIPAPPPPPPPEPPREDPPPPPPVYDEIVIPPPPVDQPSQFPDEIVLGYPQDPTSDGDVFLNTFQQNELFQQNDYNQQLLLQLNEYIKDSQTNIFQEMRVINENISNQNIIIQQQIQNYEQVVGSKQPIGNSLQMAESIMKEIENMANTFDERQSLFLDRFENLLYNTFGTTSKNLQIMTEEQDIRYNELMASQIQSQMSTNEAMNRLNTYLKLADNDRQAMIEQIQQGSQNTNRQIEVFQQLLNGAVQTMSNQVRNSIAQLAIEPQVSSDMKIDEDDEDQPPDDPNLPPSQNVVRRGYNYRSRVMNRRPMNVDVLLNIQPQEPYRPRRINNEVSFSTLNANIRDFVKVRNHDKGLFKYKNPKYMVAEQRIHNSIKVAKFNDDVIEFQVYPEKAEKKDIKILLHYIGRTKGTLYEDVDGKREYRGNFTGDFTVDLTVLLHALNFRKTHQVFFVIPSKGGAILGGSILKSKKYLNLLTNKYSYN